MVIFVMDVHKILDRYEQFPNFRVMLPIYTFWACYNIPGANHHIIPNPDRVDYMPGLLFRMASLQMGRNLYEP